MAEALATASAIASLISLSGTLLTQGVGQQQTLVPCFNVIGTLLFEGRHAAHNSYTTEVARL